MKNYEYKRLENTYKKACKGYRDNGNKAGNNYNRRQLDSVRRAYKAELKERKWN